MASLPLLLLLLLAVMNTPGWAQRFYGGTLTVSPKWGSPSGTYQVELRNRQTTQWCYINPYVCLYGHCGTTLQSTSGKIAWESYGLNWCLKEINTKVKLHNNLPFAIRFPRYSTSSYGKWVSNARGSRIPYRMMAHVDLGTRSDTRKPNRPPISTMLPIVRITRNCPRTFNLNVFDPDGDRVRCRIPTSSSTYECNLCGLQQGFSFDEGSCSLTYNGSGQYGNNPIELVVEDFPTKQIKLYYSDGSYTEKQPFSLARRRRQAIFPTTDSTSVTGTTSTPSPTAGPDTTSILSATAGPDTTSIPSPTAGPDTTSVLSATAEPDTASIPSATAEPDTPSTNGPDATEGEATTPGSDTASPDITNVIQANTNSPPGQIMTTPDQIMTTPDQIMTTPDLIPSTPYRGGYRATIPPLSKLPLQFTVLVDYHTAPSCLDGEYFPVFTTSTPANGAHIPAFVNRALEIKVVSSAQYSTIYRLLLTGPRGIYQQRVSTGSYIIKWTPTENELNDYFPICFVSEAVNRYRVYHSELRCVTVDVSHHEAVVTCNETSIKVEVEKNELIRHHENHLHLRTLGNSSECSLKKLSNGTHLVALMSLNSCGTYVEEDEENITFRNQITNADPKEIISRHNDVDIAILCVYPKKTNLTLGFRHKNPYAFSEKGFGSFTFQFEFFQSQLFTRQVDGSTYPVEVYLRQMIYMQIQATSSIPDTQLFVESCRATPYDNPESRISYTIIENGCVRDPTVQIYPGSQSVFRFGMEAFEFIGAHDEVYITCSVILCESGVPNTRCSQGCIETGSHRSRREASVQTSSHVISQGPLHLLKTSDTEVSGPSVNLGLNVFFIVGCLLVCGVVIYRSRRSRAKYQRLPTSESD